MMNCKRQNRYTPNINKIEIDITYACNLNCIGCDRSCSQAPIKEHMSIEVIEDFLAQTEQQKIEWESVHILGGEPTLHPQFIDIIHLIDKWFTMHSPNTELKVVSNGFNDKTRDLLKLLPGKWFHNNSFKSSPIVEFFEPFNAAPIDNSDWQQEDFSKGCWVTQYCGIGLTPRGYFPCAVAGGIERIFNFDYGLKNIPKSSQEISPLLREYCRYCGHFMQDNYLTRKARINKSTLPSYVSKSWEKAYKAYNLNSLNYRLEYIKDSFSFIQLFC